jgi:4-diphosphocytidyl-2-C-methyl-D-erythritol kinase
MDNKELRRHPPADRHRNDLQPVACGLFPAIAEAVEWLSRYGDARMTGSGACVFAAFAEESAAKAIMARLPQQWRGWVARGLDAHPLYAG